ncbi:MAG TPA: EamA family transporter [Candidatus Caccenecus avistercoris]|nr:EamA family transporter [Candidatus Caccenecus avistercoris]
MKYASMQEAIMQKGIFYIISILTLGLFAILWQKLLVKNQLNKVYVFKSTTIIWGMIFGYILFKEQINIQMIIGAFLALMGVIIIIKGGNYE